MIGEGDPSGFLEILWQFVQDYPDPVVFGLLFLCGVGLPVPEEPILLMAGAVAFELASGQEAGMEVQLSRMTAVCAAGILLGDLLCFHLGRKIGRGIFHWPLVRRVATRGRRVRAERFFQRYGPWAIFIARFFAGVRVVMYFSAGMSRRVSYLRFLVMDSLGALVSVPISVYIGYQVYGVLSDWDAAKAKLGTFHTVLIAGIVVGLLTWWVIARMKKKADLEEERTGRVEE